MSIIHDYLYDTWNEKGLVEDEDTIQEALDGRISYDEALNVPLVVQSFIQTIRKDEGVILWNASSRS